MPKAYIYRRCSHEDSRKSGLGMEAQLERCQRYFDFLKTGHADLELGPLLEDEAVSAYKVPLIEREKGRVLNALLRPGDHVIFARLERAFRNARDCLNTLHLWETRSIVVHFADIALDLSTPHGKLFITITAGFSQCEAEMDSVRAKEVVAHMRAKGRPAGGAPRPGFKWTGPKGKRRYVRDKQVRAIMQQIVALRDQYGMTWWQISDWMEKSLANYRHRAPLKRWQDREWGISQCRRAYKWEKQYQAEGL